MKLLAFNQGLGDCINYASMVVQYAMRGPVAICCKRRPGQRYRENVESFFTGYNVEIIEMDHDDDVFKVMAQFPPENVIALDRYSKIPYTTERQNIHIRLAYEEAGLVYEDRAKYCPIRERADAIYQRSLFELTPWSDGWAFIPEGGSECEFSIDKKYVSPRLQQIIPSQDAMLLHYRNIILNAAEIHCHDTSWPWLIDKLKTTGKLFFHRYARKFDGHILTYDYGDVFTKPWQIIDEEQPPKATIMQRGKIIG